MSYIDDHYEDIVMEQAMFQKSAETYLKKYSPQKLVDDAIKSCKNRMIDESSKIDAVTKNILKWVAKNKTITIKQKKVLIHFLMNRYEDEYEVKYEY